MFNKLQDYPLIKNRRKTISFTLWKWFKVNIILICGNLSNKVKNI